MDLPTLNEDPLAGIVLHAWIVVADGVAVHGPAAGVGGEVAADKLTTRGMKFTIGRTVGQGAYDRIAADLPKDLRPVA